ncbi:putative ankyrin and HET domain protein [Rosellinia necatrix]|uniref:Putative ankyrin and HET domain protein n=1 Tax=Rosellinia necatrix TaxID=77044 RepID=A0A1W2TWC8_ROSNE|nr:putative ankyrin and HET domain protein [Rosellinia necatrix]
MSSPAYKASERTSAVTYSPGTIEYELLNEKLHEPTLRARRANAHRPSPAERFRTATGKKWFIPVATDDEQQFQYSKLRKNEVRILRLYQSKHQDDPLRADLFKRDLDSISGGYEALSYCWGTQKATYNIHIRDLNATTTQGQKSTGVPRTAADMWMTAVNAISHIDFKIRKNLYDALRQLRSKYHDVYLWVDAICIDQSEKGKIEKAMQLAMMARIYNSASNVCVWLGEGYDGADSAFNLVRDIMNYRNFDEMISDVAQKEAWGNLISIMKAPWFGRRWVIQEIALSRDATIHCGDRNLHWDDFADAVSLLMEKIELIRDTFKDDVFDDVETTSACILVQTLCNVCRKADQGKVQGRLVSRLLDVETLVSTLLGFQATFPRDTIYSILSIAKDLPSMTEPWQDLHTEQLEDVIAKKLHYIAREKVAVMDKKSHLEKARKNQKPLQDFVHEQQGKIAEKQKEKEEARINGKRELEDRIDQELRAMKIQEVEDADEALRILDDGILQLTVKIKQLENLHENTENELKTDPIGILPNYKFSPRDLFIAFVTRSISQSESLDIICRHWAPALDDENGGDILPTWISGLSKSAFGIPGTGQGRQNGENFVSYLPHDQRRRYSASNSSPAVIQMIKDPALDVQGIKSFSQVYVPDISVPAAKLSMAGSQLGLLPVSPPLPSSIPEEPTAPIPREPVATRTDNRTPTSESSSHPTPDSTPPDSRAGKGNGIIKRFFKSTVGGTKPQSSTASSRKSSISSQGPSEVRPSRGEPAQGEPAQGSNANNENPPDPIPPNRRSEQPKKPAKKPPKAQNTMEIRQQHRLSGILCVEGFVLGTIVNQSEVMRGGVVPGEWVAKLGWKKDVNSENRVPDTLWRLLVADRMERGGKPPQWYKRACLHGLVDDKVSDNQGNIHPVRKTNRKISELTSRYFKRVETVVTNRRVFELRPGKAEYEQANGLPEQAQAVREDLGREELRPDGAPGNIADGDEQELPDPIYGLAPQRSTVSDIVCILFGCSVPVVLSEHQSYGKTRYKVVGEAYVHGMMDGEAMELPYVATSFELI